MHIFKVSVKCYNTLSSGDNIYLKVKIENELGEIKYETANAFDNVDQDEVLAYYLDDFI